MTKQTSNPGRREPAPALDSHSDNKGDGFPPGVGRSALKDLRAGGVASLGKGPPTETHPRIKLLGPADGPARIISYITDTQLHDVARNLVLAFGTDNGKVWTDLSEDEVAEMINIARGMIAVHWALKDAGVL